MRWWIVYYPSWSSGLHSALCVVSMYLLSLCKLQRFSICFLSRRILSNHIVLPQWCLHFFLRVLVFIFDWGSLYYKNPLDYFFSYNLLASIVKVFSEYNLFFLIVKKGRLDKAAGKSDFPSNFWFTFLFLGHACSYHTKESFKPGTTCMHFISSSVQNKWGKN